MNDLISCSYYDIIQNGSVDRDEWEAIDPRLFEGNKEAWEKLSASLLISDNEVITALIIALISELPGKEKS